MRRRAEPTRLLLRALRLAQEDAELMQLRLPEGCELGHHVVPGLRRVGHVAREEVRSLPALADRREVGRAEVRAPGAEVGVARGTARAREHGRTGNRVLVVGEALLLGPR